MEVESRCLCNETLNSLKVTHINTLLIHECIHVSAVLVRLPVFSVFPASRSLEVTRTWADQTTPESFITLKHNDL